MEKFSADGIVIKSSVTGEEDRIVCVLTRDRGIIRAFAKGAKRTKNRLHAATALFTYCDFMFYERNNVYNINEAEIKEMFFDLRLSIEKLTLAQYFCEVVLKTLRAGCNEEIYLRLLLNSLHLLCTGKKNEKLVKAAFELRIVSEAGYMPAIVGCKCCGKFKTDIMYFNCGTGELFCADCGKTLSLPKLPFAVISAMRHICFSDFEKIFSFELSDILLSFLNKITQRYILECFQQEFKLLSYYENIK